MSVMSRLRQGEEGSLPMALLVAIVVAGLITVLLARAVAGERNTRFDQAFTEALHVADAGINQALFRLNAGTADLVNLTQGSTSTPVTATVDGVTYEWTATRVSNRQFMVQSRATAPGEVERVLVATIEERPRFFPGAFGDQIVALNGASTDIDSYNPSCPASSNTATSKTCGWGNTTSDIYQETFGTGQAAIGTNGVLDLSGNIDMRPGGAFLYDWDDNPGQGITETEPFGDRCIGTTRCTTTYVSTVGPKLDFDTPEKMGFITEKFQPGGACETVADNPRYAWGANATIQTTGTGGNAVEPVLSPYQAGTGNDDATSSGFTNFYCAETLEFLDTTQLAATATVGDPVVIFVSDLVKITDPQVNVACHTPPGATTFEWCPSPDNQERAVQPHAARLQIYVAGFGSNDVSFKAGTVFAGIIYAPKSRCGGTGHGGSDVYGLMICGSMDNVGNWDFHYDDTLSARGSGEYDVAIWGEETP